jgi:hypothetical protein
MQSNLRAERRVIEMGIGQAIAQAEDGVQVLLLFLKWNGCGAEGSSVQAGPGSTHDEEDRD